MKGSEWCAVEKSNDIWKIKSPGKEGAKTQVGPWKIRNRSEKWREARDKDFKRSKENGQNVFTHKIIIIYGAPS